MGGTSGRSKRLLTMCRCLCSPSPRVGPGSNHPVHLLCTSDDGKWLAAANTGCQIHVYNLQKLKVTSAQVKSGGHPPNHNSRLPPCSQLHCTVPTHRSCPTAIAIHPTSGTLVSAHADQQVKDGAGGGGCSSCALVLTLLRALQIFEYSLVQKEYTQWSRALLRHGLHHLWLERDTPITHISFSGKNAAHVFLHDVFMLCVIDQTLVGDRGAAVRHASVASLHTLRLVSSCSPSPTQRPCSTTR